MFKVGDVVRYTGNGFSIAHNRDLTIVEVSNTRFKTGQGVCVQTQWSGRVWFLAKNFTTDGVGMAPPEPLSTFGLRTTGFVQCCGASILHNFYCGDGAERKERVKRSIMAYINQVRRSTGMVLVIFNETQNRQYAELLVECGFKLLTRHTNYNHGSAHWDYLYGFVCEDHKTPVREVAKAFG